MNYCDRCKVRWGLNHLDCPLCRRRLQGVEGPEQGLVAQAAERAERQGAAEDLRERGRVAPGEAEAAEWIRGLRDSLNDGAAMREQALAADPFPWVWWGWRRQYRIFAAGLRACADEISIWLPEPDSGADAPASTPTGETPTEANP